MAQWHRTLRADDVQAGRQRIVTIAGKQVGVFHERGRYFAVLNFCPHAGAPVCRGHVEGTLHAPGPGHPLCYDADRPVLRCPWHHWEFDLDTGAALAPVPQKLRTYPIEQRDDGWLYVRI